MNFQKGDILIRKTRKGEPITWLSQELIKNMCDVSETFLTTIRTKYKKTVKPTYHHHPILKDTGNSWRWGKINGKFYFDLNRIPNRKPNNYRDMFGDAEELHQEYKNTLHDKRVISYENEYQKFIEDYYKDYIHFYIDYSPKQQTALAKTCAVFEFCLKYEKNNLFTGKKSQFYRDIANLNKVYGIQYVPKNDRVLARKITNITKNTKNLDNKLTMIEISKAVKLPREGRNNGQQYTDPQLLKWAVTLMAKGENYSQAHMHRILKRTCKMANIECPTLGWFQLNAFNKPELKALTSEKKYGKGSRLAFNYASYIRMKNAEYSGDAWQVDATRLNIISHKAEDGKQRFLFMIVVKDVHSGDALGYNFDYKEDRWAVSSAIRNAVENAGYLPYELVIDRFPGHNTPEVKTLFAHMKKLGVKVTTTHKATGKASLERWFGTLQSVFMQDSKYYYGEGVKSRRASAHRSPEYLVKIQKQANKEGFNVQDAMNEGTEIIEAFRTTKYSEYSRKHSNIDKTPIEMHSDSEKPNVRFVEDYQISMLFDLKKSVQIRNNGLIKIKIFTIEHYYNVTDYNIINREKQVIISYNINDLSKIQVFKKKDDFLLHLCEAKSQEAIQPYGPNAEFNKIGKAKKAIADIEKKREEQFAEITQDADEVELLKGRLTDKEKKEQEETSLLIEQSKDATLSITKEKTVTDKDMNFEQDSLEKLIIERLVSGY